VSQTQSKGVGSYTQRRICPIGRPKHKNLGLESRRENQRIDQFMGIRLYTSEITPWLLYAVASVYRTVIPCFPRFYTNLLVLQDSVIGLVCEAKPDVIMQGYLLKVCHRRVTFGARVLQEQ
jgi:hypothetical protein